MGSMVISKNIEKNEYGDKLILNIVEGDPTPSPSPTPGPDPASGIPAGGTTGQVLAKVSDADQDVAWFDVDDLIDIDPSGDTKWYLPDGVTEDQVIAAYQFIGRTNESEALVNINEGTEYVLSKEGTVNWSSASGFFLPAENSNGFIQNGLNNLYGNVKSGAFGFSGAVNTAAACGGILMHTTRALMINAVVGDGSSVGNYVSGFAVSNTSGVPYRTSKTASSGVLSADWKQTPVLYLNGVSESLASIGTNFGTAVSGNSITLGHINRQASNNRDIYFTAFVLYSVNLTDAQHQQLAANIQALGGN